MSPSHENPRCSHRNFGRFGKKLVRDSSIPALSGDHVDLASAVRDARISTSSLCSSVLSLSNSLIVPLTSESVPNVSFKALVDSGSTDCFIESTFVRNHNLTPFRIPNIPLKLFDGTTNSVISEAIELPIQFASGETLVLQFLLTSLDKSCMVVLGHNWLTLLHPKWIPRLAELGDRTMGCRTSASPVIRSVHHHDYSVYPSIPEFRSPLRFMFPIFVLFHVSVLIRIFHSVLFPIPEPKP